MAGNIPPLVSSTPPPLNAFDDDEEEEDDEFGLYNAAEEIDYNECMSFRERGEEKQTAVKSRGEHDSTSQDSTTDSGLCPDSEGMSPTPHSDDERTLKQNSCDKLCQKLGEQPSSRGSELSDSQETASINLNTVPCFNIPNGHAGEDHCSEETDDDFGNFEFAPSHRVQNVVEEEFGDCFSRSKSPSDMVQHEENDNVNNSPDSFKHNEQLTIEIEESEKKLFKVNLSESNSLGVKDSDFVNIKEETCKYEQSITQLDESTVKKLDVALSNDSSSFNSDDLSLEPKYATVRECQDVAQSDLDTIEEPTKIQGDCLKSTLENVEFSEPNEHEVPVENGDDDDDDEFDDFTDFKADFSGCTDLSKSEQGEKINEHSETAKGQTKLEEASFSLPPSHQEESDDEFSNFADFSSSDCAFVSAQSSNSLENDTHIPLKLDDSDLRTESEFQDWVSVFPCEDADIPLGDSALLRQDDVVWSRLFPLESSPALSYQWNESLANRRLLTALNIDSRNILFTPWSTSAVPRFAANLSCGPLEPTKATEPLQPTPSSPIIVTCTTTAITTISSTQESVPDAHFDWVSSGLTNPLDCPKTVLNLPKTLSTDAENILSSLPDISFMRKTYIDFPINEA